MTSEEQIAHERHIAQVLQIRNPGDEKSALFTWLNSSLATTLIGVIGTAIIGTILAGMIQNRSKENELEQQARSSKLESQNTAINKALERVGAFLSATDDLLATVNNAYSENGRSADEVKTLKEWKVQVRARRDTADLEWRRDKESLAFTLNYVLDGDQGVNSAWREVMKAEDVFEACTRQWYTQNALAGSDLGAEMICQTERSGFEKSVWAFTSAIVVARRSND
jgi:hypothetical protein